MLHAKMMQKKRLKNLEKFASKPLFHLFACLLFCSLVQTDAYSINGIFITFSSMEKF